MRLPNKINSFNESVISKFSIFLTILERRDMTVMEFYYAVNHFNEDISRILEILDDSYLNANKVNQVDDVGHFLEILDCLYALGQIEYNSETRLLHYAGGN